MGYQLLSRRSRSRSRRGCWWLATTGLLAGVVVPSLAAAAAEPRPLAPGPSVLALQAPGSEEFDASEFFANDTISAELLWIEGEWWDGGDGDAQPFDLPGAISTTTDPTQRRFDFTCGVVSARSDDTDLASCRSPELAFYTRYADENNLHVSDGDTITVSVTYDGREYTASARWWERSRPIKSSFVQYLRSSDRAVLDGTASPMSWGETGAHWDGGEVRVYDAATGGRLLGEATAERDGAFSVALPPDGPSSVWVELQEPQEGLRPSPRRRIDAAVPSTPPNVDDLVVSYLDGPIEVLAPLGVVPLITVFKVYRGSGADRQLVDEWPYRHPDLSRYGELVHVGGDTSELYLTVTTFGEHGAMLESEPVGLPVEGAPDDAPGDADRASFSDTAGHAHEAGIDAVVEAGITSGYPDGTFRPDVSVARGQMATFLMRALDLPSSDRGAEFSDTDGHTHQDGIGAVTEAGIAGGYSDGTFRPNVSVTRGQMATFLARALDLESSGSGSFTDTNGHPHEAAIEAVVEAGVTSGYSDGTFRPNAPVTRGQMATFLTRALGL